MLGAGPAALGSGPASAAPDSGPGTPTITTTQFLKLSVDSVSPSLVTSSGAATVTVTGHIDNIGDRTLRDLTVRLERGDPVSDAAGLRTGLAVTPAPVSVATPFRDISTTLTPGASTGFTVSAPLSGNEGLDIGRTGVFPLQININGLPDYGNRAKLAESRTLLPVLSLPPDRRRAQNYVDPSDVPGDGSSTTAAPDGLGPDGSVSANISSPSPLTLLWPLAARPQLTPGVLGGRTEPVRLVGEDLSRSLSGGGRLDNLLTAARSVAGLTGLGADAAGPPANGSATSGNGAADSAPAPPGSGSPTSAPTEDGKDDTGGDQRPEPSKLAKSMCLAVDPDLLVTVRAMSLGYVVSQDPMDPTSPTTPGGGQEAAAGWLDGLREVAGQMCTVALPFGQADLISLARINNPALSRAALSSPADVVDAILGVRSIRGVTIPALGAINATGAQAIAAAGIDKAITGAAGLAPERDPTPSGRYRVGELRTQTVDAPITAALGAMGANPSTPPLTPDDQLVTLDDESAGARRQAAVAAAAYPSIAAPAPRPGNPANRERGPVTGRSSFLMPPTYWSATPDDTNALLTTATVLLESGVATPAPLPDVVDELGETTDAARFGQPPVGDLAMAAASVDEATAARIRDLADQTWQIQASLMDAVDVTVGPERYLAPLREDLLRAIATPSRTGAGERAMLLTERTDRMAAVSSTMARIRDSVTILDPGGRYTLASERSPLLLVVRNDLSLPIRVRMNVDAPDGLVVGDVGVIEIPARGTRQIQLPTRAATSEAVTVTIGLTTSSGVAIGSPITLSVHANAYGKPLFWITVAAAIALVGLTARRLWHRFRGQPDPADEDRPDPDERDRLLAASTYHHRRRTLHGDGLLADGRQTRDADTEPGMSEEPTVGDDHPTDRNERDGI